MNYFVNENVFTLNSGTEFSAIRRVLMFKANHLPAKVLTRNYNPQLASDVQRAGLEQEDVLNMYDYFQEFQGLPIKDVDVRYTDVIDKRRYQIEGVDGNESLIKEHGRTIAKVRIAPATVGLVGSIEWYNDNNLPLACDIWDRRGFKSSTQYFHPDNREGAQVFYNREGIPKLEITAMNINGELHPTMYKLLNYKGENHRFNTEEEMFIFFLEELAAQEKVVLINDRPSLIPAVAAVTNAEAKWQFLHTWHSVNNNQAGASRQIVDYLQPLFRDFADKFDGVLVGTEQQAEEIRKVSNFKQVLSVADTFAVPLSAGKLKVHRPDPNRIVFLGRLAADKTIFDVVDIFGKVHAQNPAARLTFMGYASPADMQQHLEERIEQQNLKDFIEFKGYLTPEEVEENLSTAGIAINTSMGEGFGMTILDVMSHAVPVAAYNVKYGPSLLIDNGKNGILTSFGAVDTMVKDILELQGNPEKLVEMGQAAYEKAQQFNLAASWKRWEDQHLVAANLYVGKD